MPQFVPLLKPKITTRKDHKGHKDRKISRKDAKVKTTTADERRFTKIGMIQGSHRILFRYDQYQAKDIVSGKVGLTKYHRGRSPEPNLRKSASIRGCCFFPFFVPLAPFCGHSDCLVSLCGFASLADVAKGGNEAKSALREVFVF